MTKLLTTFILSTTLFVGGTRAAGWPFTLSVDCSTTNVRETDGARFDYQIQIGNDNKILKPPSYATSDCSNNPYDFPKPGNMMRFRYDPGQCEEIKSRFEGDKACPAGQYRLGQYLTPHGANATNVCIDVPADTACDVGQYRGEADGDCFDVPADTSADLQTAQADLAAANTAAVELAAEVEAEKGIAAVIAAEVKAEKDALVLALQAAEAALAASVANTCGGGGQYREEAGGECKSVDERLWTIIEDQQDQIPGACGRTRFRRTHGRYTPNALP